METVMEEAVTAVAAKRYTVMISLVEVDEAGEVVEELYGCRLDNASTEYNDVDGVAALAIQAGEEAWVGLFASDASTPRNLAWADEGRQMIEIASREGQEITLECTCCQCDSTVLSADGDHAFQGVIRCGGCDVVMQVVAP